MDLAEQKKKAADYLEREFRELGVTALYLADDFDEEAGTWPARIGTGVLVYAEGDGNTDNRAQIEQLMNNLCNDPVLLPRLP